MSCNTSGGLLVFYYIKIAANIIFIVTPIILLIMCTLDIFKGVTGDYSKENVLSKAYNTILKRFIIAIIILILPMIVSSILSVTNVGNYSECFNKATKANIEALEKQEKIQKELEIQAQKKKLEDKIKELNKKAMENAAAQIKAFEEKIKNQLISITNGVSGTIRNILNIPYYNQCDNRWGGITYDTGGATLCSSACGYTSLAMIVSGLSGNSNINPYTIIKDIRGIRDGGKTSRGYGAASTYELTSSAYLSKYGVKAIEISKAAITSSLNAGSPVIVLVPGHYLALSKSTNGNIVVLDPYSNWASKAKGSGEFSSVSQIERAYGAISWAASYRRG